MSNVPLSMAIGHYDHVSDLVSGRVRAEGIHLTPMDLPIEEIFFRMFSFREWDISEFSMAKYVSLVAAGNSPFRAIPVFPSRVFRQSAIYVTPDRIRAPQDLAGKRIGIPEWTQTAGIYARAFLQHQCKLSLADIHWVQAGVNQPGRTEKVSITPPPGLQIERAQDRSLNEMLLAGDIDGIISAREPAAFLAHHPKVARLFPAYQAIEEDYYRQTGIFPIMHVIIVKSETLDTHPWVAMNLLRAFEQSKQNSIKRLSSIVNSAVPLPWTQQSYDRAISVFGQDFWPYGIEPNRPTLTAFLQFCAEQGVTPKTLSVEDLFPSEVSKSFKV